MQTAWRDPCRQAPGLSQTHCFRVYRLAEHTLQPGATQYRDTPGGPTPSSHTRAAMRYISNDILLVLAPK